MSSLLFVIMLNLSLSDSMSSDSLKIYYDPSSTLDFSEIDSLSIKYCKLLPPAVAIIRNYDNFVVLNKHALASCNDTASQITLRLFKGNKQFEFNIHKNLLSCPFFIISIYQDGKLRRNLKRVWYGVVTECNSTGYRIKIKRSTFK